MVCLKNIFSREVLNRLARETKFIQRESFLTAEGLISLCGFSKDALFETSLGKLSSVLALEYNIKISPQALNERFNKYSVEFFKNVLNDILIKQHPK